MAGPLPPRGGRRGGGRGVVLAPGDVEGEGVGEENGGGGGEEDVAESVRENAGDLPLTGWRTGGSRYGSEGVMQVARKPCVWQLGEEGRNARAGFTRIKPEARNRLIRGARHDGADKEGRCSGMHPPP
jgi:hypothetical protein